MDELKIYVKSSLIHKDPKQRAMPISECTHSHVNTTITIQLLSVALNNTALKLLRYCLSLKYPMYQIIVWNIHLYTSKNCNIPFGCNSFLITSLWLMAVSGPTTVLMIYRWTNNQTATYKKYYDLNPPSPSTFLKMWKTNKYLSDNTEHRCFQIKTITHRHLPLNKYRRFTQLSSLNGGNDVLPTEKSTVFDYNMWYNDYMNRICDGTV